jgi:DNA-binding response OmpR family regulator
MVHEGFTVGIRMHIVHVDDDLEYCALVDNLPSGQGLAISQANTVADAWERVSSTSRVIGMCDFKLCGESALDLLRKVPQANRVDYFVVLTGRLSEAYRQTALDMGASEIVQIPLGRDKLERLLSSIVRRAVRPAALNEYQPQPESS